MFASMQPKLPIPDKDGAVWPAGIEGRELGTFHLDTIGYYAVDTNRRKWHGAEEENSHVKVSDTDRHFVDTVTDALITVGTLDLIMVVVFNMKPQNFYFWC